jgi:penicillin-binding protein 2
MKQEKFGKYRVKRLSRESIEAEEIFLDSKKLKESPESEREKMEFPIKKGRVYFLYFLIIIFLLILFVRAIDLQVVKGDYWRSLAEGNRIRSYPIKALRGIIYDRNNKPLVSNEPRFSLVVVPADLFKQEQLPDVVNYLVEILEKPREGIEILLRENANLSIPITIAEDISRETALILESKFSENPAISVEIASQRNYIDGLYFSHIFGYLGKISPEEREEHPDYLIDDYIGKTGLELYYENFLRGSYGEKLLEVDSQGEIKNIFARKESQPGKDIFLSIDSDLQKKLYNEIKQMLWGLKTNRAAGVALDPNTGKILALVSFPTYDNNKFIQGFSEEEFEKIIQNPSKPLFNRVITGTYPPGSTIKPLIATAALKEEIITPNKIITCFGSITIQNKYYPEIFYTFHDWKIHGLTNAIKAIAQSCNVYFYTVGGGYGKIEGLGIERIGRYLKQFGLGKILGIDLPGEVKGLIPDENWKRENKGEDWYLGDTYNVSIGQGDIMATPLQIALATTMIANNGTLFKPQIINKVGENPVPPQIIRNNIIDKGIFDTVKKGMREAIISGSAVYLYDLPIKVAGKTGTAQASGNRVPHGWFTSFAPYENPEIVLTILIENGGEGSAVAVPVAKEVLRWYFTR